MRRRIRWALVILTILLGVLASRYACTYVFDRGQRLHDWRILLFRLGIQRTAPPPELSDFAWEEDRLHFTYTIDPWDGNPDRVVLMWKGFRNVTCRFWDE